MVLQHLERFSNRFYGFWGLSGKPLEQSEKAEIKIMKTFLKRFVPKKIFLAYQQRSWPLTAILYWLHSTQNLLQILARFELSPYYVKPILPLKHLRNDSCLPYFQMFKRRKHKELTVLFKWFSKCWCNFLSNHKGHNISINMLPHLSTCFW